MRIGVLARSVIDEMAELTGHRAEIADLPEQPLDTFFATAPGLRHEAPGPLGQMNEDRARLENRERAIFCVVVNNRRHAVIGADRQELGLELVAAADIDRDHTVFEAALLEHDRNLPAVRGRPVVEVDHRLLSSRNAAISAAE